MLNQIVLVGRLTKDLQVKEENNKKVVELTLAIPRSFKNAEGVYETDFVEVKIWDAVASNTKEYCKKGDILGVEGRLQSEVKEDKKGNKVYTTVVIAEKVTFLSSRPKESE